MDGGDNVSNKLKEAEKSISELEETIQQLDAEIQRIDEQRDEILRLTETWRNERSILCEKRGFLTSSEEIQNIDDRITDIEQQLDRWEQDQNELLEHRDELTSEKEIHFDHVKKTKRIQNPTLMDDITGLAKGAVKKAATAPVSIAVQTVKSGVKSAISKANPFDKQINKNDVTDSGVESIRLAYTSVKKAKNSIKAVSSTVKTTHRTIKTAGKAAKATVKIAYKTPIFIVKTAIKAVRIAGTITANVVAAVMNPVVIVIAAFLLFFIIIAGAVVLILGGGASASISNAKAHANAVGLVNVPGQYQDALEYFNVAVQSRKDAFYALIDSMYYNYNDLTHSDLAYMERTDASGRKTPYETSFATDTRKDTLKSAWDFSADDVRGIIAVAYVYLEKQENEVHGTEGGIYEVTYTQEVFDLIAEKCINFNDSIYGGQLCPQGNCTRHVEYVDNPEYLEANRRLQEALDNNRAATDRRDWENQRYWYEEYYRRKAYRDSLPSKLENVTYICEYQHNLHSIGLWYYSKESIMDALNFTDNEKQWVNLTEMGFESNPDIP